MAKKSRLIEERSVNKIIKELDDLTGIALDEKLKEAGGLQLQKRANQLLQLAAAYEASKEGKRSFENPYEAEKRIARDQMYHSRMVTMCLLFQSELDKCVNALPRTVIYVEVSDKGEPILYEQPLSSLANLIGKTASINMGSKKEKINERIFDEDHLKQGKAAYQGVWNRLNAFRTIQEYNLLMWKESGKWQLANVQSFGDIAEAYVNFIYSRHGIQSDFLYRIPTGYPKYYSHQLIGTFFKKYIAEIDNASPIRGEDVVVKKGADSFGFQAAVKATGASTFGFEEYLKVARYIRENSLSTITKKDIEEITSNPAVRNKVRIELEEFSQTKLQEALDNTSSEAKWHKVLSDLVSSEEKFDQFITSQKYIQV